MCDIKISKSNYEKSVNIYHIVSRVDEAEAATFNVTERKAFSCP